MPKTINFRLLILATLFGFLGGAISNIALPQLVFAQGTPVDRIVAREFQVVDDQGRVVGWFGSVSMPALASPNRDRGPQEPPTLSVGKVTLSFSDGSLAWYAPPPPKPLVHPLTSGATR